MKNFSRKSLQNKKKCISLHSLKQNKQNINDGAIAQLVEQRTENPCVPGSNPGGTTWTKVQNQQNAANQWFAAFFFCQKSALLVQNEAV